MLYKKGSEKNGTVTTFFTIVALFLNVYLNRIEEAKMYICTVNFAYISRL